MTARLSLNQATTSQWNLREAAEGCARHGVPGIALWRDKVAAFGLERSARLVHDLGLSVSSLCRGGFFPATTREARAARFEDNLRALDEAATLGAEVLVLVCGGVTGRDVDGARAMVADALAALAPHAARRGVKLGIEPLHPMFAADRSVVVTLAQALDLARPHDEGVVGVVVDVYHVWWDPAVYQHIQAAGKRIFGFHVNDWITPLPDPLLGRGMMGDGVIELRRLREAVDAAGYAGPIEVEIFNRALWNAPGDEVLATVKQRYAACVA